RLQDAVIGLPNFGGTVPAGRDEVEPVGTEGHVVDVVLVTSERRHELAARSDVDIPDLPYMAGQRVRDLERAEVPHASELVCASSGENLRARTERCAEIGRASCRERV